MRRCGYSDFKLSPAGIGSGSSSGSGSGSGSGSDSRSGWGSGFPATKSRRPSPALSTDESISGGEVRANTRTATRKRAVERRRGQK